MTGDLGALGFWLMLGMIIAASILKGGLKERDKEREREVTLRALLDKDEKTVTEVLAYLREKDAADRQLLRQMSGLEWRWSSGAKAVAKGILAFVGVIATGFFAGLVLHYGFFPASENARIPLIAMFGIWAAGPIIAWRVWRSSKQKNDARPNA
jgi:hypothetical protein